MNGLQIFENSKFGSIRTIIINNEPFFVGKDIAEILGYVDTYGALKKHVDEEDKQNCQNDSFETPRGLTVVNESGLYSLVIGSKLPSAKKFKRWVTSEVLPSIRKHGMYAEEELLDNSDLLISVIQKLKEERERNKVLQNTVSTLETTVQGMDKVIADIIC